MLGFLINNSFRTLQENTRSNKIRAVNAIHLDHNICISSVEIHVPMRIRQEMSKKPNLMTAPREYI